VEQEEGMNHHSLWVPMFRWHGWVFHLAVRADSCHRTILIGPIEVGFWAAI
jgi:hypothetical protein